MWFHSFNSSPPTNETNQYVAPQIRLDCWASPYGLFLGLMLGPIFTQISCSTISSSMLPLAYLF